MRYFAVEFCSKTDASNHIVIAEGLIGRRCRLADVAFKIRHCFCARLRVSILIQVNDQK